jgi:hypothetical protein
LVEDDKKLEVAQVAYSLVYECMWAQAGEEELHPEVRLDLYC